MEAQTYMSPVKMKAARSASFISASETYAKDSKGFPTTSKGKIRDENVRSRLGRVL